MIIRPDSAVACRACPPDASTSFWRTAVFFVPVVCSVATTRHCARRHRASGLGDCSVDFSFHPRATSYKRRLASDWRRMHADAGRCWRLAMGSDPTPVSHSRQVPAGLRVLLRRETTPQFSQAQIESLSSAKALPYRPPAFSLPLKSCCVKNPCHRWNVGSHHHTPNHI